MGVIESLGLRIRELRKKKGFTQDGVAEKAGITGKYMGMLERGEVNVSVRVLESLANELGVTIPDLFDFENLGTADEQRKELLKLIQEASDSEIKLLFKVARSLLK